jgi:hypothetical protein
VLNDIPGSTTLIEHEIKVTTSQPIRIKAYAVPFSMTKIIHDEKHLDCLGELLPRLRDAKCSIVYNSIECLGLIIRENFLKPHPEKVRVIKEATRQETKRQLRSFLRLLGFYRKFVPNFWHNPVIPFANGIILTLLTLTSLFQIRCISGTSTTVFLRISGEPVYQLGYVRNSTEYTYTNSELLYLSI